MNPVIGRHHKNQDTALLRNLLIPQHMYPVPKIMLTTAHMNSMLRPNFPLANRIEKIRFSGDRPITWIM
jgi:hypothetical protein